MLYPQLVTCSRILSFQHPAIRSCGDLVRWKSRIVSALSFSSCQSVHMTGVWIHTAAANTITLHLALDLVTKPLTFLCFSTFAPPTYLVPTASCAVSKRNKEGLSAGITNMTVREEDVHDRDPVRQGHVSAFLSHLPRLPVSHSQVSCVYPPH